MPRSGPTSTSRTHTQIRSTANLAQFAGNLLTSCSQSTRRLGPQRTDTGRSDLVPTRQQRSVPASRSSSITVREGDSSGRLEAGAHAPKSADEHGRNRADRIRGAVLEGLDELGGWAQAIRSWCRRSRCVCRRRQGDAPEQFPPGLVGQEVSAGLGHLVRARGSSTR